MKAYRINQEGEDFILAADTNLGALRQLCTELQLRIDIDFDGSEEINEIPESEWSEISISAEGIEYTLSEVMIGIDSPQMVGSTVFD